MNKKISLIVFIVIAIAMNLAYFNDTTDFSADFGLVALAQFPGGGPGETDPFEDNWGDCILCYGLPGEDKDVVMIECYYQQGATGSCSEVPCNYGWC